MNICKGHHTHACILVPFNHMYAMHVHACSLPTHACTCTCRLHFTFLIEQDPVGVNVGTGNPQEISQGFDETSEPPRHQVHGGSTSVQQAYQFPENKHVHTRNEIRNLSMEIQEEGITR